MKTQMAQILLGIGYTARMPLAALLMLSQPDPMAAVLRMRAMLAHPFTVSFTLARKDFPAPARGTLAIQRPNRMRFIVKLGADDYESWWSEDRTLDMSRVKKAYFESGPFDHLYKPDASFSALPSVAFPTIALAGDVREADPSKPSFVGTETVGGVTCDHIKTRAYDAWIAADGRLMRWRYEAPSGPSTVSTIVEFSQWKFDPGLPKSYFETQPPAGFVQDGLPKGIWPAQEGQPFPEKDWVTPEGKTALIEFGKPFLAMATSSDCEISPRALKALTTLEKDVPVWLFSEDGKAPAKLGAFKTLHDKSGRTLERLFAPGTPFFVLVDKEKRVKKLWFGFDTADEDKFVREVRAALAK